MGRPRKIPQVISKEPIETEIEFIPVPWDKIIEMLLSRNIKLYETPNEGQIVLMDLKVRAWKIALQWLIRWEWNKKYKLPFSRKEAKRYEAKGRFLQAIFRLCERCHTFQGVVATEVVVSYPNAAYWFGSVFWDFILNEIQSAFYSDEGPKGAKKAHLIKKRRDVAQKHINFENPLSAQSGMKATYELFQVASLLAERSPSFQEDYWNPFIKALEYETNQLSTSDFQRIIIDQGKAYIQQAGPGRGKIYIPLPIHLKQVLGKI